MKTFLSIVATDVIDYYNQSLTDVSFILPNRRSVKQFTSELSAEISKPMWAPQVLAVSDWVVESSVMELVSDTEAMIYLFEALMRNWDKQERFENFLDWGEVLLKDFDELDKYLVDPELMFRQISDEKEISERFSMVGEPEFSVILKFWTGLGQDPSAIQKGWLDLWNCMLPVYLDFHHSLNQDGKATLGQMYRELLNDTVQSIEQAQWTREYCFIGFNAPVQAEEALFEKLQKIGKARFYWDAPEFLKYYPTRFRSPESFSQRLSEESHRFSSTLQSDFTPVQAYSFETGTAQARHMAAMIQSNKKTAVILGDESLLDEFGWGLGLSKDEFNISIGQAFSQTRVGLECFKLLNEQEENGLAALDTISFLDTYAAGLENDGDDGEYHYDAARILRRVVEQLKQLKHKHDQLLSPLIVKRLSVEMLRKERIAFEPNYDAPIQITGILESRLMDFEEVVILSFNEGIWPAGNSGSSFIPYHLRMEFKMPVLSALDKMYGYHFFRLLRRARKVRIGFLALNETQSIKKGEKSRFLRQLEHLYDQELQYFPISGRVELKNPGPIIFKKEPYVLNRLKKYTEGQGHSRLSPSAMNTYVDCSLKFYYQYILGLRDPAPGGDLTDARLFGTLVHESMEEIYRPLYGDKLVTASYLEQLLQKDYDLVGLIRQVLKESDSFKSFWDTPDHPDARLNLVLETVAEYVKIILATDLDYAPFRIVGLEEKSRTVMEIPVNGETLKVRIGGIIDRIDQKDGEIRVIDYKTGKPHQSAKDFDSLLDGTNKSRSGEIFQTLVYCYIFRKQNPKVPDQIIPGLYALRNQGQGKLNPKLTIKRVLMDSEFKYLAEVESLLQELLAEILDPLKSFEPTSNVDTCRFCRFNLICQRNG